MADYILKATFIWIVLLLAYSLGYARSGRFGANRIYLLLSIAAGLLLPLLPAPWQAGNINALQNWAITRQPEITPATPAGNEIPTGNNLLPEWTTLAFWLYIGMAAVLMAISLLDIIRIIRKAVYGQYISLNGFRIFESHKPHAPFSFMGWIFITDAGDYSEAELLFLLRHENAHNYRKHWADIIFMQLCCILFWFNPAIWIFRHLLKMQHEYEADYIASGTDRYGYGRFLLNQVLLRSTSSIAHSFHYSPIKSRINMLTKTNKGKSWKYLITLPALALCTIVMAESSDNTARVTHGNITTFKGNKFRWVDLNTFVTDTIIITDPATGQNLTQISERYKRAYIDQINKDTVFDNQSPLITPAQYRAQNKSFDAALNEVFKELNPKSSDTINEINIMHVVIDQRGKIAYYDLEYHCESSGAKSIPYWDKKVEEALNKLPAWLPGLKDGTPVATFSDLPAAIRINPTQQSWQVKAVSEKDLDKIENSKQR